MVGRWVAEAHTRASGQMCTHCSKLSSLTLGSSLHSNISVPTQRNFCWSPIGVSSLSLILRENTTDISSYVLRGKGDPFKRNSEIRTKEVPLSRKKKGLGIQC